MSNIQPNTTDNDSQQGLQIDLQTILSMLWNMRWWVLASVVAALSAAVFYLHTCTNFYASNMMVLITTDKNAGMGNSAQMSFLQDMTGVASYNSLSNEKIIISSTPVMQKVVEEMNLNIRYFDEQTFRVDETSAGDVRMHFIPTEGVNINRLPFYRIDYEVVDSTSLLITVKTAGKKGKDIELYSDTLVAFGSNVPLGHFGNMHFTYMPRVTTDDDEPQPSSRYIELYSPQRRARELAASMAVDVIEEKHSSSMYGGGSSIMMLTMQDNLPRRAEMVLEKVVEQYNLQTKEYYSMSYTNTMEFIQSRLSDLKEQLADVEGRIKDYSIDHDLFDLESQANFSLNQDMKNQVEAQEIEIQIRLMQMVLSEFRSGEAYSTVPSNIGIADASINQAINEYNKMCVERVRLLTSSSENSPVVQKLYLQLDESRKLISKSIENQISILTSRQEDLKRLHGKSKSNLQNLPGQKFSLAAIEREQSVIEPLYVLLQKKREETMLAIIAEPDIARIVEHSENTSSLVGPNRNRILGIAFLLGFLFPIGIVYLRMLFKTKVTIPEDIVTRTKVPLLGVVPKSGIRMVTIKDIVAQSSYNTTVEVFRTLRTSLSFMEGKVLQITSSVPGEGKSFVSTNIAVSFASAGKRTILVETDMRKGHQRRTFAIPRDRRMGLSDYLSGNIDDWHGAVNSVEGVPMLDVLLKGTIPPNPNELLSGSRFETLIAELRETYDYVILDSPPFLLIADPMTINRVADRNIYIMRAGVSDLRFISELDMAAQSEKLTKPVIVLNGIDVEDIHYGRSRYGYGYGYIYGYSYGYGDNHKNDSRWKKLFKKKNK
ncbi:MAG: polysaccharide biosynthesis tyrosine autokinase [Bacteroidales bacterium]|nr:polysaccharide biosynthesis tyrosine autokinase [Candidatus Liminaster caballi]